MYLGRVYSTMEGSGGGDGEMSNWAVWYDLPGLCIACETSHAQHRELKWEVACHRMSHGHAIRSKKSERGEGVHGSPEVFPIISRHYFPLAPHHRPSTLVYNEFVMYGNPTEWEPYRAVRGRYRKGWGDEHAYQSQVSPPAHLGPLTHNIGT